MTPTEQTRLEEIRKDDQSVQWSQQTNIGFLLSLLSQETKRADEAEARK